jgi:hypothetical protein
MTVFSEQRLPYRLHPLPGLLLEFLPRPHLEDGNLFTKQAQRFMQLK